jgi:hypothetical protein
MVKFSLLLGVIPQSWRHIHEAALVASDVRKPFLLKQKKGVVSPAKVASNVFPSRWTQEESSQDAHKHLVRTDRLLVGVELLIGTEVLRGQVIVGWEESMIRYFRVLIILTHICSALFRYFS